MVATASEPDRLSHPVPPAIIRTVVRYVDVAVGPDGLDTLLERLAPDHRVGDVLDPHRWATHEEAADVIRAAARICGDDQIGRRIGEEHFRSGLTGPFSHELAAGSVESAFRKVASHSSKVSLGRTIDIAEAGPAHLVLHSRYLDPSSANRFACDFTAGYLSQLPGLFGQLGTTVETECVARGGTRCAFRVAWRPDPSRPGLDLGSDARARRRHHMVDWFERSEATAARLVGAADICELLDEVVHQASQKLDAPRIVLTARLRGDRRPRVHQVGFDDGAEAVAEQLPTGGTGGDDHLVVAPVAAGGRTYGHLAAVFPPGSVATEAEQRILSAHAHHAASALHALASLERARRDRDTARVLLSLARAFSEVTTVHDVGSRLALAIPEATACDVATVWLFHPGSRTLRLAGCRDRTGAELPFAPDHLRVDDFTDLLAAMRSRRPTLMTIDEAPAEARAHMVTMGVGELAVVPIAAQGTFLGIVTAGFATCIDEDDHDGLFERLRGLAAHAGTALQNAELLERTRHQALHDTLTGLPNRSLVEDRGHQALAAADRSAKKVGLLFLDLDGFKEINDTHGHHVGDALIRQVGTRLDGLMRASDTVARMGGDEFVVLMPEVDSHHDAVEVAERIVGALARPLHVEGRELTVSCSVGVATADGSCRYDDLLRRADAAMYAAKADGGHGHAVDRHSDAVDGVAVPLGPEPVIDIARLPVHH